MGLLPLSFGGAGAKASREALRRAGSRGRSAGRLWRPAARVAAEGGPGGLRDSRTTFDYN
jgi:hypothetical protein